MLDPDVALAVEAAREAGLDPAGARLLRRVASTHVELPEAGALARVEKRDRVAVAERIVETARFLAARNVRAVRLIEPERQPFVFSGGVVTICARVESVDPKPTASEVGKLARELHRATAGPIEGSVPDLDLFASVWPWLEQPGEARDDVAAVRTEAKELERAWQETAPDDPLGVGFVHGDLHLDNVLRTPEGLVLVDLEEAGRGPRSWDLVPHWIAVRRYGRPESVWTDFRDAYGFDPETWDGFAVLCRVFELLMVAWAFGCRHTSQTMAEEARLRVASFLGRSEETWTLL